MDQSRCTRKGSGTVPPCDAERPLHITIGAVCDELVPQPVEIANHIVDQGLIRELSCTQHMFHEAYVQQIGEERVPKGHCDAALEE